MDAKSKYADLYLRISIDREGKSAIERQEADCRAWVTGGGLKVRQVHVDRGRSGFQQGVDREGFRNALAAVSSGVVGTLVVWKLDRLSRQGIDDVGDVLDKIRAAGGRLVSVHDNLDTSLAADRQVVGVLAELARSESENLGLRIRSAKAFLRTQGRWIGGAPPYGLINRGGHLFVDPAKGAIVREIASRILAGQSLVAVARWLNEADVPSPRGGRWAIGTIAQLMRGPATAGMMPETLKKSDGRYSGTVRPWKNPDTGQTVSVMALGEDPLISPQQQLRIKAVFDERTRSSWAGQRAPESRHLLTGLLRCAECGERMSRQGNSYRCQAVRVGRDCPAPGGTYQVALDDAVTRVWFERLTRMTSDDPLLAVVASRLAAWQDPDAVAKRLSVLSALEDEQLALSSLDRDYYVRRIIDRDRYLPLSVMLTERIDGLRRSLDEIPMPEVDLAAFADPNRLQARWAAAATHERRDLLKLALREVRVTQGVRGQRFEAANRLAFIWANEP